MKNVLQNPTLNKLGVKAAKALRTSWSLPGLADLFLLLSAPIRKKQRLKKS